jgi:hypothetical protein
MATQRQESANRLNAQYSTGPKTEEGKSVSSLNALKHGLTAQTTLLPDENPQLYSTLSGGIREELRPVGCVESVLVDLIVGKMWRLGRIAQVEVGIFRSEYYEESLVGARAEVMKYEESVFEPMVTVTDEAGQGLAKERVREIIEERDQGIAVCGRGYMRDARGEELLAKLMKYETATENALYRAFSELRQIRENRIEGDLVESVGFVFVLEQRLVVRRPVADPIHLFRFTTTGWLDRLPTRRYFFHHRLLGLKMRHFLGGKFTSNLTREPDLFQEATSSRPFSCNKAVVMCALCAWGHVVTAQWVGA